MGVDQEKTDSVLSRSGAEGIASDAAGGSVWRSKVRSLVVVVILLAAAVLILVAQSGPGRPIASDWASTWDRAVTAMPTSEDLGDPPDRNLCSHALGELRSIRPDLIPTPDPALDAAVDEWMRVAEDALFECPPASGELPSLASAFDELVRLQAAIDVVLDIDLGVE